MYRKQMISSWTLFSISNLPSWNIILLYYRKLYFTIENLTLLQKTLLIEKYILYKTSSY